MAFSDVPSFTLEQQATVRSFLVFQEMAGWYWTEPGFTRPVGPFETLAQTLSDLQRVMEG